MVIVFPDWMRVDDIVSPVLRRIVQDIIDDVEQSSSVSPFQSYIDDSPEE